MIYKPAKTCTLETFSKDWQECQKVNTELIEKIESQAIANGGILHRFLYESVADGKAIYQIIKENKKTVRVRLCCIDGLFADYVVPQWGEEASISKEYAERAIHFQDIWRQATGG
jgi:hypothetical protein